MSRPITLFTGQWADLPLAELAPGAWRLGYDGLELACWGDHFDVDQAASSKKYCREKWQLLTDHGLTCYAISNHLTGQAVCDRIDERHRSILPPDVWGDGQPEGVRRRAARKMIRTAQAARRFFDLQPGRKNAAGAPAIVNGFTGSSIWHSIYSFPPTSPSRSIRRKSPSISPRRNTRSRRSRGTAASGSTTIRRTSAIRGWTT